MTADHRIICGAAAETVAPETLCLDVDGEAVSAELRISQLSRKLVSELPDILCDLLEVAAFVYAADAAIRRGGPAAEHMGAAWRRKLSFEIPVRCLDRWADPETTRLLTETLGFLSEDHFSFSFRAHDGRPVEQTIPFEFGPDEGWVPDEVVMFSGGLDSFAGAVEALVERHKRLALVSHHSAQTIGKTQRDLANVLRDRTEGHMVRHFPVRAAMHGRGTKEGTHRTRSFLFAALGMVLARSFGLNRLDFHENGIVSLNLPPLAQFVGARATRSTHPQALRGLSELFSTLISADVTVANPSFWRTKKDVVTRVAELGFADQIKHTRSCANVRTASKMTPHCGRCSQCIDRRFAILGAGLVDEEPGEAYEVDLLNGARVREDRELALAYVRNARTYRAISPSELLRKHPEVARAIDDLRLEPETSLNRVADLYNRHGRAVTAVMERALDRDAYSPDSLLSLYAAGDLAPLPAPLTPADEQAPLVLIEIDETRKRARIDGKLTLEGAKFKTLRTLADLHLQNLGKGIAPEDFTTLKEQKLMAIWELGEASTVRRRIQTLRRTLKGALGEISADLVENVAWHGYRLCPEAVTIRKTDLT